MQRKQSTKCENELLRTGKQTWKNVESADKFLRSRGVPKRYLHSTLSDFPIIKGSNLDLDNGSFYITGQIGSGKTHLLCAMLRETSFGISSRFLTTEEMLIMIKDTYNPNLPKKFKEDEDEDESNQDSIISNLCDVGVLALDDFGLERITEWSMSMMRLIINHRYNEMKRTYISSNLDLEALAEHFDTRLTSRIYQMCEVIRLEGRDRRVG